MRSWPMIDLSLYRVAFAVGFAFEDMPDMFS